MADNVNNSNFGGKFSDTNLIVNYLPPSLSDADFKALFESIGPVSASRIIRDRTTGLSYGYGFIDFVNPDHAKQAIETLDGMQLQNKRLKVSLSRQGDDVRASNLYISNLPKFIADSDLQNMFSGYGTIIQTKILTDPATGASRGVGFVRFSTREEAQNAMDSTNGTKPVGFINPIAVKFAEDNREKAKKIQQAILSGTFNNPGAVFATGGPVAAAAQAMGIRPPAVAANGANQFGVGYQGDLGGGPIRGGQPRQRFDPMGFGGGNPTAGMFGAAGMNGFAGMVESAAGYPLFVYNIGTETDERALFQLFYPFGALQKVTVVRDSETKQSKGYGFVTMVHMHEAQNAIKNLNGMLYNDKRLQVSLKQPKGQQQQFSAIPTVGAGGPAAAVAAQTAAMIGGPMSPSGCLGEGGKDADSNGGHVLFVYNIGLDADERQLWQLFQPFGAVLKVHVSRVPDTRKCKGFGFVTMARYSDAQSAIQSLNGYPYGDRRLQVSFKQAGVGKNAANTSSAASTISDYRNGMTDMGNMGGMGNIANAAAVNNVANGMGSIGIGNMQTGVNVANMGSFGNGIGSYGNNMANNMGQYSNFFGTM